MNEKKLEEFIKLIDREKIPSDSLKDKMYSKILKIENKSARLSVMVSLLFERPLQTAAAISIVISGVLWLVFGNGYCNIITNL